MKKHFVSRGLPAAAALAAALVLGAALPPAAAHGLHHHHGSHAGDASAASALSLALPVAVSVAAPAALLSGGVALTVVSVHASVEGTVWVLERAADDARASVTFAGAALEASAIGIGTAVLVTALSTGWVVSAAGEALVFIPNEIGAALLHSERLTD